MKVQRPKAQGSKNAFLCVANREKVVGSLGRKGTACRQRRTSPSGAFMAASHMLSMITRCLRSWVGNQFCGAQILNELARLNRRTPTTCPSGCWASSSL